MPRPPPYSRPGLLVLTAARETVAVPAEKDADQKRDDDHDDQRRLARAQDPVDLDLFEVEHGEQGDQNRHDDQSPGARQLFARAPLALGGTDLARLLSW